MILRNRLRLMLLLAFRIRMGQDVAKQFPLSDCVVQGFVGVRGLSEPILGHVPFRGLAERRTEYSHGEALDVERGE